MNQLLCGDSRELLKTFDDCSIDSCVTDPPYELGFMGKHWDNTGVAYDVDLWREVLRVLKPGACLLSFDSTRTYHRMACAIEDAGFEIRDQLQWIYGSGFPKSLDISKAIDREAGAEREIVGERKQRANNKSNSTSPLNQSIGEKELLTLPATDSAKRWNGWGTALKPANEPICLARKPLSEKTVAKNVLKFGTGGLNIDGGRIETIPDKSSWFANRDTAITFHGQPRDNDKTAGAYKENQGRWPSNVIFGCACENEHEDGCAVKMLDEQSGESVSPSGFSQRRELPNLCMSGGNTERYSENGKGDSGTASRFFYIAKASTSERDEYMHTTAKSSGSYEGRADGSLGGPIPQRRNTHPTVKPIALMRYLCRLVTPPSGLVLDPFAGSGSTLIAARLEGFQWLGIELDPEHVRIAELRMSQERLGL